MSVTRDVFYNLFWQNKACQNLFLLSKEEFLDSKTITLEENSTTISFPRIILSNIQSKDEHLFDKIKLRTETQSILTESVINSTFEKYAPILGTFLETKFGKSIELFLKDFSDNPWSMVSPILLSFFTKDGKFEKRVMQLLHEYEFIGKHINTFTELETYVQKEAFSKNFKTLVSEQNLWTFFELLKSFKDIYVHEAYKGLYNSNQVLVSAYHDIDNFEDRLRLFSKLYESAIIKSSKEDSFIECTTCSPSTYKGVFQLRIDPERLRELKCPICNSRFTFYVPYELDMAIYNIVKAKDGLLLDALVHKLDGVKIKNEINSFHLNDIEIDCIYSIEKKTYMVECKMYKQLTAELKLKKKFKEHFSKLINDIIRIQQEENKTFEAIIPILLVNINNPKLLTETLVELRKDNEHELYQRGMIITINDIPLE